MKARDLQVGDRATTDYGKKTQEVTITARKEARVCQSGVMFQVTPPLRNWRDTSNPYDEWPNEWYDSEWFAPIEQPATR